MQNGNGLAVQDRLSAYDEKVLRRLVQLETARRQERKQGPLAFVKRDTEAGSAMRRLDQLGMIGAMYKDGNPYVVEVLAKGYSYLGIVDEERAGVIREERHRKEDRRHDWLVSVFTVLVAMTGVIAGFLIARFL
ncbi:MAG: histidine kinase [Slackia sp.]|nr:histidine kinase [Slackia sp.]